MITFEEILIEDQAAGFSPEPIATFTTWTVDTWKEMVSHVISTHQQEQRCVNAGVLVSYTAAYFILEDN